MENTAIAKEFVNDRVIYHAVAFHDSTPAKEVTLTDQDRAVIDSVPAESRDAKAVELARAKLS